MSAFLFYNAESYIETSINFIILSLFFQIKTNYFHLIGIMGSMTEV